MTRLPREPRHCRTGLDQGSSCVLRQLGHPLDRHDLGRELCKHRRLITRARADVEDAVVRREPEELTDGGDDEGLRDRLPVSDWKGSVLVGEVPHVLGDESLPRHSFHRGEHAFVERAATTELLLDHVCPRLGRVGFGAQRVARRRHLARVGRPA